MVYSEAIFNPNPPPSLALLQTMRLSAAWGKIAAQNDTSPCCRHSVFSDNFR
jgi:hypothetical protein